MKVLVACEESQRVCIEFRKLGHEAYYCDIQECSGGHPEWHIKDDVIEILQRPFYFKTSDGGVRCFEFYEWDMVIAFPPCTNLAVSGARWFKEKIESGEQQKSIDFFMKFVNYPCKK